MCTGAAMTPVAADAAGNFLSALADRWQLPGDRAPLRAVVKRACGGQLAARRPDGRRASTLTSSGTPFEVSVTGGGGRVAPVIRYVTETATQETTFAARLVAQRAAIRDLVAWLPNGDEKTAEMLQAFVSALYPGSAKIPAGFRSPIWLGVVHRFDAPHHIARLKVYGFPQVVPGTLERLREEWPGFAGLAAVSPYDGLFAPDIAALEVDAQGEVNHKVYLKARLDDVAVPMKLVRCFGESAWEALSELVDCGIDAKVLHQQRIFVCRSRSAGDTALAFHVTSRRHVDLAEVVREAARRNLGSTDAVDVLTDGARSAGAAWRYSAIGLGYSQARGIDKVTVYGTPTWAPTHHCSPGTRSGIDGAHRKPAIARG